MLTTQTNNLQNKQIASIMRWILIILGLAVGLMGIILLSRSSEKGENYISLQAKTEAQKSGQDPCNILLAWLAEAKAIDNKTI